MQQLRPPTENRAPATEFPPDQQAALYTHQLELPKARLLALYDVEHALQMLRFLLRVANGKFGVLGQLLSASYNTIAHQSKVRAVGRRSLQPLAVLENGSFSNTLQR